MGIKIPSDLIVFGPILLGSILAVILYSVWRAKRSAKPADEESASDTSEDLEEQDPPAYQPQGQWFGQAGFGIPASFWPQFPPPVAPRQKLASKGNNVWLHCNELYNISTQDIETYMCIKSQLPRDVPRVAGWSLVTRRWSLVAGRSSLAVICVPPHG
ncbi:hypothetical protein CORC01_11614 [Colletotrichum orchidophilum]|uniref:Uncharacterized protein n=1 Tax=Colletotrichum orchidophilum TaxID=1209926 RepID=A0A1G4AV67_9PEZI|nr:uncharacterized protein CORC01_11614 [Colletotrichum orchidophilum]OHE93057.1 hypothetical protein CORC01_11614 [Colletotrichum orchidophilum]